MKRFVKPAQQTFSWAIMGGLIITLPMLVSQHWPTLSGASLLGWLASNLGYSVVAFSLVVALFVYYLWRQYSVLISENPDESQVQHLDSLTDTMVSLSFGVGVIWTAIGMRNALSHGLAGFADNAAASGNAFEILARLVDGGLLVALSTTIVGGVLGYLLRVAKSMLVGRKLNDFYQVIDNRYLAQLSEDVAGIKHFLAKTTEKVTDAP